VINEQGTNDTSSGYRVSGDTEGMGWFWYRLMLGPIPGWNHALYGLARL